MRVLVVGSGAREHAVVWKLRQSPNVSDVLCAPGNPGMAALATCIDVPATSIEKLADLAHVQHVDLTVACAEEAIHNGIVDYFKHRRMRIFGPSREAARLSWSRYFAKELMLKHKIPTARYAAFEREDLARAYVESRKPPIVIKPGGPSGGYGVAVASSHQEAHDTLARLFSRGTGPANETVIIEDFLEGEEVSVEVVCDGARAVTMVAVQVARRLRDEDRGPITPGMGAYAPCTTFGDKAIRQAIERIIDPLILALSNGGTPYTGVLHLNLSIDAELKPRVLGIGSTLGDLESQVLLPLLDEDLFEIFWAVTEGDLAHFLEAGFRFSPYHCLALAICGQGHRWAAKAPLQINGLAELEKRNLLTIEKQVLDKARPIAITVRPLIFHEGAGAHANSFNISAEPGQAAAGARILTLSVIGESLLDAKVAAYELAGRIEFEGMHYRRDVGDRGLE